MAVGLWVVSSQVKPFLSGHNSDVLPSLILISSLFTIILATVGYNGSLHSASPNADERFYSVKTLMWFELLGTILGELQPSKVVQNIKIVSCLFVSIILYT